MRRFFLVAAKLMGLLVLYWTITLSNVVGRVMGVGTEMLNQGKTTIYGLVIGGFVLQVVLSMAMALILLFRTEALARWLKIEADDQPVNLGTVETLLKAGLVLIGVYILAVTVPPFVKGLYDYYLVREKVAVAKAVSVMIAPTVQIVLAAVLALRAGGIVDFILRKPAAAR